MQNTIKEIQVSVEQKTRFLTLSWADGLRSSFHYVWLRDNCQTGIDPISNQRQVNPMYILRNLQPNSLEINNQEQLVIIWNDEHKSTFDLNWLRSNSYSHSEQVKTLEVELWDASLDLKSFEIDYGRLMSDEKVLKQCLVNFKKWGFIRLTNVPTQPKTVLKLAEKLSYIWNVAYGNFFEIKRILEKAAFLGYTNKALTSHTDNAYYEPVPPVQLLHCIVNETKGGDSTMVDGFRVAAALREKYPEKFQLLSTLPLNFHWKSGRYYYKSTAPLISLNSMGELQQIRFSNQSVQPFQFPMDVMEAYYDAYVTFSEMAISPEFQVNFRFKPGDLNMIDNHRILHGRTAFSETGTRLLEGCFLGRDGLYSTLEMLEV